MFRKSFFSLIGFLVLIGFSIYLPQAKAATLLYSNDFEGSLGDIWKMMDCYDYTYTLVSNPVRSGKYAVKYLMKGNQGCYEFDGKTIKHRAQLMHGKNAKLTLAADDRGPYWFGFSMYVSAGFPTGNVIVFDTKDNTAFYGEMTAYLSGGNKLDIRPDGKTSNPVRLSLAQDQWNDFVIYLERSQSDGVLKVWLNGNLVSEYKGATISQGIPPDAKTFFRTGLYWGTDDRGSDQYSLYFDNVSIAKGGSDGYNLVNPAGTTVVQKNPPVPPSGISVTKN